MNSINKLEIKLCQPNTDDFGPSLVCILDILEPINIAENTVKEVQIDISEIVFVHPLLILPLSVLSDWLLKKGIRVNFSNGKCQDYLEIIRFPNGFNPYEIENWLDELAKFEKSYLPICKIPSYHCKENTLVRDRLISNLNSILFRKLNILGNLRDSIAYLVSEMIDNITDHAMTDYGWIMFQNYPQMGYLDICIADNGIGILDSYKRSGITQISNHNVAIEKALNGLSTKKLEGNRGYGIVTSRKLLVDGLNGKFFIYSGNAAYFKSRQNESILKFKGYQSWNGTLIALRIPKNIKEKFNLYDYIG